MPLLSVQRGWGTWPLFLRTLHAAAFADVGHAWTGPTRWADRKIGYGAETLRRRRRGIRLPLTWTAGIGWGDDGAGVDPRRARSLLPGRAVVLSGVRTSTTETQRTQRRTETSLAVGMTRVGCIQAAKFVLCVSVSLCLCG